MRAVVARSFGEPEAFTLEPVASRPLGAREVRIQVRAVGLSFVDRLIARGEYQVRPQIPFTPGSEFAGLVVEVGASVTSIAAGDRVCGSCLTGALSEEIVAPESAVWPVPESLGFDAAAVFQVSYATAYYALVQRGCLKPGETVLVLGASGAVGAAAVQIATALGARVIAGCSPARHADAHADGASAAVDVRQGDWRDRLKQLAPAGVEVVVDPIGGDVTEQAFRSLAWNGRHLVIGFASGERPRLPVHLSLLKGAALIGVDVRTFGEKDPQARAANYRALCRLEADGVLTPRVAARFPLTEFAQAFTRANQRAEAGRVVVTLGD